MSDRIFLFAGEASGDLHGSRLIQALHHAKRGVDLCGVGGPRMRQEKFACLIEMEEFQVMGLADVIKSLPKLWRLFYRVRNIILQMKPCCVILIDYPGFNLRLAQSLRKKGYKGKIVQFVCPTIWAHGKERIETLEKHFDLLLTIFPFEATYFSGRNLKVVYVGNPLIDMVKTHCYHSEWHEKIGVPRDQELVALFPGSRQAELLLHVPQQLQAAARLKARHPHLIFGMSCAQERLESFLRQMVQSSPLRLNRDLYLIPSNYSYELMKGAKAALAKSGTVTLELALHSTPTAVHYELSTLNYLYAKYFLKLQLPHYCIVNILANFTLFPELIGRGISSSDLGDHLERLLFDSMLRKEIANGCQSIEKQLGSAKSHICAAQSIAEILR